MSDSIMVSKIQLITNSEMLFLKVVSLHNLTHIIIVSSFYIYKIERSMFLQENLLVKIRDNSSGNTITQIQNKFHFKCIVDLCLPMSKNNTGHRYNSQSIQYNR